MTPTVLAIFKTIDEAYGGPDTILGAELSLKNDVSGTLAALLRLSADDREIERWQFPIVGTYLGLVQRGGWQFAVLKIERVQGFLQYRLQYEWTNLDGQMQGMQETGLAWFSGKIANLLGRTIPPPMFVIAEKPIIRRWQLYTPPERLENQFWLKGMHQFVGDGDAVEVNEAGYFCQVPLTIDLEGEERFGGHQLRSILRWEGWRLDSRFMARFSQFTFFCAEHINIADAQTFFSPLLRQFERR